MLRKKLDKYKMMTVLDYFLVLLLAAIVFLIVSISV